MNGRSSIALFTRMDDYTNFLPGRLSGIIPSLSASQALRASASSATVNALRTGLEQLDEALAPPAYGSLGPESLSHVRGIPRGQIIEIYGPPAVGKTSLATSIAVHALGAGGKVVWIDTSSPIPIPRLCEMLRGLINSLDDAPGSSDQLEARMKDYAQNFIHIRAPSLPHLLALLLHSPAGFPPEGATLLVVDSVSALFRSYFPNVTELKSRLSMGKITDDQQFQWLLHRKSNVASNMATQLMKLAATRNLAVLLINQASTKVTGLSHPILYPALGGGFWETAVHSRVVLYRDLMPVERQASVEHYPVRRLRFAEVTKKAGKVLSGRHDESITAFFIVTDGLCEIKRDQMPSASPQQAQQQRSPLVEKIRKRKLDEIADSQDEDGDEDEESEESSADDSGWIQRDEIDLLAEHKVGENDPVTVGPTSVKRNIIVEAEGEGKTAKDDVPSLSSSPLSSLSSSSLRPS